MSWFNGDNKSDKQLLEMIKKELNKKSSWLGSGSSGVGHGWMPKKESKEISKKIRKRKVRRGF